MDSQVVVQILGHKVVDICADGRAHLIVQHPVGIRFLSFPHVCGAEFGLGLAFEVRLLYLYADGTYDTLAAVCRLVVFLEEILEGLGYGLSVCCQMSTAVAGVLSVYE